MAKDKTSGDNHMDGSAVPVVEEAMKMPAIAPNDVEMAIVNMTILVVLIPISIAASRS